MSAVSFKLDRFAVCRVHGTADVIIEFNADSGSKKIEKTFPSEKLAVDFVNREKTAFIRLKLEKYLKHKKILFETGKHEFYQQSDKLLSLDIAWRCLHWIQDKDLKVICPNILKIRKHLFNTLPIDTNPSYSNSEEELNEIIQFCNDNCA